MLVAGLCTRYDLWRPKGRNGQRVALSEGEGESLCYSEEGVLGAKVGATEWKKQTLFPTVLQLLYDSRSQMTFGETVPEPLFLVDSVGWGWDLKTDDFYWLGLRC